MSERRFEISWPDLGQKVGATFLEKVEPEICEDAWKLLPVESIIVHSVSSGRGMYCPFPVLRSYVNRKIGDVSREAIYSDVPKGRILYCYLFGFLIFNYGQVMDRAYVGPHFAQIDEEEVPKLEEIGKRVWTATAHTPEFIKVRFSRS